MSYEAIGLLLVAMGLFVVGAAMLMSLRRVRREMFTVLRHPAGPRWSDEHQITIYERLPLHDWQEAGEL